MQMARIRELVILAHDQGMNHTLASTHEETLVPDSQMPEANLIGTSLDEIIQAANPVDATERGQAPPPGMLHWGRDIYLPFGSNVYVVTVQGQNEGEEPGVFVRLKGEPPPAWVKHQVPPVGSDALKRVTSYEGIITLCQRANQAAVYRGKREFPGLTLGMLMEGKCESASHQHRHRPTQSAAPPRDNEVPPGGKKSQIHAEDGMICYGILALQPDALLVGTLGTFVNEAHANETPINAHSYTMYMPDHRVAASLRRLKRANLAWVEPNSTIVIFGAWTLEHMATPSPVKGGELRRGCFGLLRHLLHELSRDIGRTQSPPDESTSDAIFLKAIPTLQATYCYLCPFN